MYMTEEAIRQLFGVHGKIISIRILRDERTGQIRGTAFVRFDRKEEAQSAIQELNGQYLTGSKDPLAVRVSEEHGKQKAEAIRSGQIATPVQVAPVQVAPVQPAPHPYFPSYSGGYSGQSSSGKYGGDGLIASPPFANPAFTSNNSFGGYPAARSRSPQLMNPAFMYGQQQQQQQQQQFGGGYDYREEQSRGGGPMRGGRDGHGHDGGSRWGDRNNSSHGRKGRGGGRGRY